MNLTKIERYLLVNLLEPGPLLIKKVFTGPRSHEGWETPLFIISYHDTRSTLKMAP